MEAFLTRISGYWETVVNVFSGFDGISDVLDVLFVAVIVASLLIQLRRTQSLQILKGLVIVSICFVFVNLFQMEAAKTIFSTLISNALLIVVVIFSSELRQFLSKVGQAKWPEIFKFNQNDETRLMTDCINSVCRACASMSDDKIGSLIVFQRKTALGDLEHTGVPIDSIANTEMLLSVFFPNSALHDGAIIIKNSRIAAARCVVSLKNDHEVHEKVGTRHRAAMEISRATDAIAVVTSEETGIISIAVHGELIRGITDAQLREQLDKFLLPEENSRARKIRHKLPKKSKGGETDGR